MASKKITSCDYEIRSPNVAISTTGTDDTVTINTTTFKVNGNLEVSGTTVYVDSVANVLNILDPNIVLNSNANVPYSGNSGIIVNRGGDDDAAIFWNETSQSWQLTTNVANTVVYSNVATFADLAGLDDIPLPNVGGINEVANVGIGDLDAGGGFPTTPPEFANLAFANVQSGGGTRIYFNNGVENGELISKKKAIVYSIIF